MSPKVTKRVAVIGAGASGLPAIKSCLDERLDVVCFERSHDIGGLWRFTDTPLEGQACVMKTTVINTSKEMMAYSDFPIPGEFPIYMHNSKVLEYLRLYASKFHLEKHVRFNTEVLSVKRAENFAKLGQWNVSFRTVGETEETTEIFDGVLVCTGHHADKYVPEFEGLKDFKGTVVHTHDYRNPEQYDDKKVLLIGIGNSSGDCAVELSRRAKQILLSTRKGTWILNRVSEYGMPIDMMNFRRFLMVLQKLFPGMAQLLMKHRLNSRFDHQAYSLQPNYLPFSQHPMVNDDMPNRIVCGSIKIKTDIQRFMETGAEFVDGTKEDGIDSVILGTGYTFGFPFIDKEIIDIVENRVPLYKYMYPPDLEKNTLAVIGCFQPVGAIFPISELQTRLAVRVIKGVNFLPPRAQMWEDIREKEAAMAKRYNKTRRHTIQVDYMAFMDELAQLVGCEVDLFATLKTDPKLALQLIFGPVYPYHYRLFGPGQWSGARQAILTGWDRTLEPLKTRPVKVAQGQNYYFIFGIVLIAFFLLKFLFF